MNSEADDVLLDRERALLFKILQLIRNTFSPTRSLNKEQNIVVSQRHEPRHYAEVIVVSDATSVLDGNVGCALLTELKVYLGVDVVNERERLKTLLIESLAELNMLPARARTPPIFFACLRPKGEHPSIRSLLVQTLKKKFLPNVVSLIEEFAGDLWWSKRRWDGHFLPTPTRRLKAYSMDVPPNLVKVFDGVACINERTEIRFSDSSIVYVEWGPLVGSSRQMWMRGTSVRLFIALIRREYRRDKARQPRSVLLKLRGVGDVMI